MLSILSFLVPFNEHNDLFGVILFLCVCHFVLKLSFSCIKDSANQEGNMCNCMWSGYLVFS